MRFDLVRPCADCPFRNDKGGFGLRAGRVREILGGGSGRAWWPSPSFPCHKTIEYRERGTHIGPTAQQCAGVMIILHREHRHNDTMQVAQRLGYWDPAKLDLTAPVYMTTQQAIEGQERC